MTDQLPPPPPGANHGDNPKAAAKAAKAYAKATRPWYKKKRFIIPIAVVVLIVLISALNGGGDGGPEKVDNGSSSNSTSDDNKAGSKSNPIKVGETVKLEGTQYTVKSAKTASEVGGEFLKEKADGVYVIVELTIENKKNETKTFFEDAAKFIGSNDKKYSTDNDGTFAAIGDDGEPLFLEDMQPDVPKSGILVFDVPKDAAKGGVLEVSDLYGRGEAYIDLGLK